MHQIALGTVGELEMRGLTIPSMESAQDPASVVCLPVDRALRLLLPILETLWKLDRTTQAKLLKVSPSTLTRYRTSRSIPRRPEQLQRIEDLFRCYNALRVLLPNPEAADTWPTRRNTRLAPNPIAYALRHGTRGLRQYLEAELVN